MGTIDYRVDIEIIDLLGEVHPEWSIVLIGYSRLGSLLSRNNFFFLGSRDKGELPNYLQCFDVSIIPYAVDEATKAMYPIKLHEYLAAGKPVASTNLPELKPFKDVIKIAKD